jgi:hypothetical protein
MWSQWTPRGRQENGQDALLKGQDDRLDDGEFVEGVYRGGTGRGAETKLEAGERGAVAEVVDHLRMGACTQR